MSTFNLKLISVSVAALTTMPAIADNNYCPKNPYANSPQTVESPKLFKNRIKFPKFRHTPDWVKQGAGFIVKILNQAMKDRGPVRQGDVNERSNSQERTPEQYVAEESDYGFRSLLEGGMNMKLLGGPYYYNEYQGGAGVQYDFVCTKDDDVLLAVRFSPLFLELAWIKKDTGARRDEALPSTTLVGSSVGLEAYKRWGGITTGGRVYFKPQLSADATSEMGTGRFQQAYLKVQINELLPMKTKRPFFFENYISHYDRGNAKEHLYQWEGAQRNPRDLKTVWEFTSWLVMTY